MFHLRRVSSRNPVLGGFEIIIGKLMVPDWSNVVAWLSCAAVWDQRYCQTSRIDYRTRVASFTVERRISRNSALVRRSLLSLEDSRIEFANLQIGFQLAYYRVRLFRLKAGGKGINVDTPRKTGGLLQRPVSHCLRCCSLPCIRSPPFSPPPPYLRHRPPVPWLPAEVKLDKWMLTLNINRLLRLIINLTSDSKQTFHLCSSPVSSSFTFSSPLAETL